jgi:hypothetical protein
VVSDQNDRTRGGAPRRGKKARLLLGLLGVVLGLVAGEIAVRLVLPSYAAPTGEHDVVPGPPEGPLFRLRPGQVTPYAWDGDPFGTLPDGARITYRADALGYRSGAGPPDTGVDLLVLGDSFTFGEGVEIGRRFTELLAEGGGGGRRTVYNAGVPGYSTLDEMSVLPELLALRPRAVLVVAQPNDAVPIPHAQARVEGDLLAQATKGSGLRLLDALRAPFAAADNERWYLSYWTGENARNGQEVSIALGRMRAAAAARGADLGVAVFPLLHRLDDYPFEPIHRVLVDACRERSTPVTDLLPAFAGRDERDLWVHPADHHPNSDAHAIAAEAMRPLVDQLLR